MLGPASGATGDPPNIVIILADDLGFGDLGVTGNPLIETPHIDALASGSASMANFYVSPVCSPTRASLMTGRYNYRTRVVDTFKGRSMMDPDEVTLAEVLRDAGYATGIFGKWHLGDAYPLRPSDQGFEESLVHRGGGLVQPSEPIENDGRYTDPILFKNNNQVQAHGYCTDVFFDAAIKFIDAARADSRPFLAYVAPNAPHGPFHDVPETLYAKYKSIDLGPVLFGQAKDADTVARVYAMVENIDENVGRLMDYLRSQDILANTLVVFMTDNGPATRRYVGPMRGQKSEVYDGGIRSPFFAHWPARLKPGAVNHTVAAHIDLMPTLLDAASVDLPQDVKVDGRSILPLLEGRKVDWPDRTVFIQSHRGDEPVPFHNIAVRSQRWKLIHPSGFGTEKMPSGIAVELYDMAVDSMESTNLAAMRPDIVKNLRDAYTTWFEDVSTTRPDNFAPPRIIIGSDQEKTAVLTWQDWRVAQSDGWGRDGKWLLHARQGATYDIELRWPAPIAPSVIELRVGKSKRTLPVEATASVTFGEFPVPKGDLELMVTMRGNAKEVAYHVILHRLEIK
jgi:arylsulfatase/arylsulfatase A